MTSKFVERLVSVFGERGEELIISHKEDLKVVFGNGSLVIMTPRRKVARTNMLIIGLFLIDV